jgi:hypothetical protein
MADYETFYQAVSGDSCWTIVSEKYTQDEFYAGKFCRRFDL